MRGQWDQGYYALAQQAKHVNTNLEHGKRGVAFNDKSYVRKCLLSNFTFMSGQNYAQPTSPDVTLMFFSQAVNTKY